MKLTPEILVGLHNLSREIERIENNLIGKEFVQGYVLFSTLYDKLEELAENFFQIEGEDTNQLDLLEYIVGDGLQIFDFEKLSKKDRAALTDKEGRMSIRKGDIEKYPKGIIKFKDVNEAAKYVIEIFKDKNKK